ncbi:subunit 1 of eukaryotic peptide chain release factor, partial [Hamiltosporidium tvaerminnensis]
MDEVQIWKTKKILKNLKNARGNGTSMISLIIPPKECISRSTRLLTDEYGTASNIKSRVNKNSVLSAIVSAQAKLKTYSKTPTNGLAIYVGTVVEDTKEKKVSIGIEPIKPINTSLYMCDSKFHVDDLLRQYEDESKFGIIVMDGHSTLFSTVQGNVKTILQELTVDLPKKHGRGGQSSVRFARLRLEKRLNYIKKVAEIMNGIYLTDSKINVEGLILAGHSDFKNELKTCDVLDHKIREKIVKIVDVNYGGENGLNQAIELSEDVLKELKLSKEKNILKRFFEEMALDGKYCYSIKDT